jgi:DNA modification methylase
MAPYPSVIPLLPILLTTKIGDTVLDIFNGTGTTTAVALQLGRKAIGYDTDTKSHQFASKRLQMVEENLPTDQEVIELENEFMVKSESIKENVSDSGQELSAL